MKLIKMECPYCGASLKVPEGEKKIVCQFCGKTIEVDPEEEHKVITIKDEAKLKEAELKEKQYEDEKTDRERREKKAFKKTKAGRLIIALIVIDLLFALAAFSTHRSLSGIIALIQIALLVVALLIGNGSIENIKGKKIPYVVFLIIACVLAIPFITNISATGNRSKKEKLVWSSSELAKKLPEPNADYGEVVVDNDQYFDADIDDFSKDDYQKYLSQCKKKGFIVDAKNDTDMYEAADKDGYVLRLMSDSDSMSISLDAPADYQNITWPVSALAQSLPAPPVNRGAVKTDDSDKLLVLIPDIDDEKFNDYVNKVLDSGFNIDYSNNKGNFSGSNADGLKVNIHKNTGNVMQISLEKGESNTSAPAAKTTSTPATTPEVTATPKSTAAPTTGIRPEFKSAMDSYKATVDAYCEFMKTYDSSNAEMLAKYAKLHKQYLDTMSKLDKVDESELSPEEEDYYLQTMADINQKLLETAQYLN